MRRTRYTIVLLLFTAFAFGQRQEFKIYSSGFMYSDTTMGQLALIVDSLNLKFRSCDLDKTYYGPYQAKAHYVSLDKGRFSQARKDMDDNMPYDEFVKKYIFCKPVKDLLVARSKYTNYRNKEVVRFETLTLKGGSDITLRIEDEPELYNKKLKGTWVYDHYNGGSLRGFYFPTEITRPPLPEAYARMVQYSECLVDTSTQIYKEGAQRTGVRIGLDEDKPSKVNAFMKYINKETEKPAYGDGDYDTYWKRYSAWDSTRFKIINQKLSKQKKFQTLLNEAVAEAREEGGSSDEFEEYVGHYYSLHAELDLKRGRKVIGGCSQDMGPRYHAMNIAVLSAETINWEVFLRAHLDIMNDRFERMTDGSYAWAGRKTYIKELEALDISVPDLMLGISLRIENPSENHYYGSISRLGRALAETKYAEEIEEQMLTMIKDNGLDVYNRLVVYYLFLNYNYYIEDESRQKTNGDRLDKAVETLPDYLSN